MKRLSRIEYTSNKQRRPLSRTKYNLNIQRRGVVELNKLRIKKEDTLFT